jgi:hypothetical protein
MAWGGGACSGLVRGHFKERHQLEDQGVDGRLLRNLTLTEQDEGRGLH